LGIESAKVNITRLKEQQHFFNSQVSILSPGRGVLLAFGKDIGSIIAHKLN